MTTDFAATKRQFHLPEGLIYLDGNSLGPLPKTAAARVAQAITGEWGELLIRGWNKAGWMDMPTKVGNRVARLIGAETGHAVDQGLSGAGIRPAACAGSAGDFVRHRQFPIGSLYGAGLGANLGCRLSAENRRPRSGAGGD